MFQKRITLRKISFVCWAAAATAGPALAQDNLPAVAVAPAARKEGFSAELDLVFQAFKTRNYDLLKPLLDPKAKIGSLPQGMNDRIVPQILKQMPESVSYVVTGVVKEGNKEGDATRVNMTFTYADGKALTQSVVFNANHKITALDLPINFQSQVINTDGGTRVTPDKIEVPFELRDNLIRVSAQLNGKTGSFVFDSGSPGLVLNADLLAPEQLVGNGTTIGVGGTVNSQASHIDTFGWNGLKISDFYAVAFPLGHLDKSSHLTKDDGESVFGLIGTSVFKDYEVSFDYARKILTLVRTDKLGEPIVARVAPGGRVAIVPFEMHLHIPVFPIKIGNRTYQMGLDSGAGSNLLYAKYWADVQHDVSNVRPSTIGGIGKERISVKTADLSHVSVGGAQYPAMHFAFEDGNLNQLNANMQLGIDGLLGYWFLREHITSINYKKRELRIYEGAPKA